MGALRLSLGCGKDTRPGWVRLDANPEVHPDILATVPPIPEFVLSRRWDEIELNHFLASLYKWEAKELLCQLWQVMAPGGKLVIETPDIGFAMRHFILTQAGDTGIAPAFEPPEGSYRPGQLDLWCFFGNPETQDKTIANHWGYTPKTLRALLIECGFEDIHIHDRPAQYHLPIRDFRMEAYK